MGTKSRRDRATVSEKFLAPTFPGSSRIATLVSKQHPKRGDVSSPTPGAEGTALLLVGQKPATPPSAGPHPATMRRLKSITAHRTPGSARPRPCGFPEAPTRGERALAPTSTPSPTLPT